MGCNTCSSKRIKKITRGDFALIPARIYETIAGVRKYYDFAGITWIKAIFNINEDETFNRWYLPKTGDTVITSDLINNISTENIEEGQPISGPGIPAGSTVLKTPLSEDSPTIANQIKISQPASANGTASALLIGDIEIIGATNNGLLNIPVQPEQTSLFSEECSASFKVVVMKNNKPKTVHFENRLVIE